MAKNRGICAAHPCIPQNREYPPRDNNINSVLCDTLKRVGFQHRIMAAAIVMYLQR